MIVRMMSEPPAVAGGLSEQQDCTSMFSHDVRTACGSGRLICAAELYQYVLSTTTGGISNESDFDFRHSLSIDSARDRVRADALAHDDEALTIFQGVKGFGFAGRF